MIREILTLGLGIGFGYLLVVLIASVISVFRDSRF